MEYVLDPLHSDVEFKIKHLMISTVKGRFERFEAGIIAEQEDFSDAYIWANIDMESINTSITDRDNHLRGPDFFDVEKYPQMLFRSTRLEAKSEPNKFDIYGQLTIKGITKDVCLNGIYNGNDEDNYGETKYGFEIEGKINRKDWDLNFNIAGGKSTLLIGDDVRLDISIQMTRSEDEKY